MKSLVWKEWRENWQSILWAPLLVLVLTVMAAAYNLDIAQMQPSRMIDVGLLEGLALCIWLLCPILCGSGMAAPEIGGGTLQFLSALPLSRGKIWTVKCLVGFACALLCIAATTLVFVLTLEAAGRLGAFGRPVQGVENVLQLVNGIGAMPVLLAAPLFSMGMLMTMMVDRTLNAIIASAVASAALAIGIVWFASELDLTYRGVDIPLWGLGALTIPALLSMSYQTFVRGETLKTTKRFKAAVPRMFVDLLIVAAAIAISIEWILH